MPEITEFQKMLIRSWVKDGMTLEEAKALFMDMYNFEVEDDPR